MRLYLLFAVVLAMCSCADVRAGGYGTQWKSLETSAPICADQLALVASLDEALGKVNDETLGDCQGKLTTVDVFMPPNIPAEQKSIARALLEKRLAEHGCKIQSIAGDGAVKDVAEDIVVRLVVVAWGWDIDDTRHDTSGPQGSYTASNARVRSRAKVMLQTFQGGQLRIAGQAEGTSQWRRVGYGEGGLWPREKLPSIDNPPKR